MTKYPEADGAVQHLSQTKRELALQQSNRENIVFDALIAVLEETPEALSSEYSGDFLCELVRPRLPHVTTEEIVRALEVLSARAVALRDVVQTEASRLRAGARSKRRPARESRN